MRANHLTVFKLIFEEGKPSLGGLSDELVELVEDFRTRHPHAFLGSARAVVAYED
jgi:hypothetical protein